MIVTQFTEELQNVQTIFEANQHNPPQHSNMPLIVSKVIWVTALIDRIQVSYISRTGLQCMNLWLFL